MLKLRVITEEEFIRICNNSAKFLGEYDFDELTGVGIRYMEAPNNVTILVTNFHEPVKQEIIKTMYQMYQIVE